MNRKTLMYSYKYLNLLFLLEIFFNFIYRLGKGIRMSPYLVFKLVGVFIFFVPFCGFSATVSIERASLRLGFSPRVKDHSWTEFRAVLKNPHDLPKQIKMRLVSDSGFFLASRTIFEYDVLLPAKSELLYVNEGVADGADSHRVELYENDVRIGLSDNFLLNKISAGRQKKTFVIISDDFDVSVGSISQLPEYKENLFQSSLTAEYCPQHYSLFSSFDCVVMLRPDFSKYSERQFRAISDYVLSGGRLVFADPKGIIDAEKTPLAELLPVRPLSIKRTNRSLALKSFFPSFSNWSEQGIYVDFLESFPAEGSHVLIREGLSPLFSIKRFGSGSVFASSFSLTENVFKDSRIWGDIIKLAYINNMNNKSFSTTVETLDGLTGFSIPPPSEIKKILMMVIIPTLAIIGFGIFLRKGVFAWGGLAIFALFMTWWIFSVAGTKSSSGSQMLLASIDTVFCESAVSVCEGRYSFFSKKDTTIDVLGLEENCIFSGIPPDLGKIFSGLGNMDAKNQGFHSEKFVISEPVESKTTNGVAKIANLQIKANASRQFQQTGTFYNSSFFEKSCLSYEENGIFFEAGSFSLPEEEKIDCAGIIFPAGIAILKINEGKIRSGKIEMSNMPTPILLVLQNENPLSRAFLAVVTKKKSSDYLRMENDVRGNCLKAYILPLHEKFHDAKLVVPFELTELIPADNTTRMFAANCRKFSLFSQDDSEYRFKFKVPEHFAFAKTDRIEVQIDYISDGGNVEVIPYITSTDILTKMTASKQSSYAKIACKEKKKDIFVFSGKEIADIIDLSGCGVIILDVKMKNKNLSVGQKLRDNQWSMRDFKVAVLGTKLDSQPTMRE